MSFSKLAFPQSILKGVTFDKEKGIEIPFVNIGIKNKNVCTISTIEGNFSLVIPSTNYTDTLIFSRVGYEQLSIPIKYILDNKQSQFQLKAKPLELAPANITSSKLTERSFGIKNTRTLLHFTDGSINQNDIVEIAQLVHLGVSPAKITSVNLFINEPRSDSGVFRINFYGFSDSRPTQNIFEKNITQTHAIKEGWLKFDLKEYGIYLKGDVVVSIEFIPSGQKTTPIYYEVKLGGSSKSFMRTNSQGEWNVPPHHYRMFLTALVNDTKGISSRNEMEEKESKPDFIYYSKNVKDTFSIFVHMPNSYNKRKYRVFPVVYVLDANAFFDLLASEIDQHRINCILIGIGYKDLITMDSLRNRDYTYPTATEKDSFPISGGGSKFLSFLTDEIIPVIDKKYPTDTTNRTLMGHSLGGYFTLFALQQSLLTKNNTFTNYIAASPSLDYSENYLLKELQNSPCVNQNKQNAFISAGGKEDSTEEMGKGIIDNLDRLSKLLSMDKFKNIKMKSEIFLNAGHMETAIPSFTNALQQN